MVKKFCTHLNMKKKKATQIKNEKKFKKCDLDKFLECQITNYDIALFKGLRILTIF